MRELEHIDTLLYYDGPELIVAKDQFQLMYLCYLIETNNISDIFLCTPVSKARLEKLLNREIDLRDVLLHAESDDYFIGEVHEGNFNKISTKTLNKKEIKEYWIPKEGFYLDLIPPSDQEIVNTARARNRAVIKCKLSPPESKDESKIDADKLISALEIFQKLIDHAYSKTIKEVSNIVKDVITDQSQYKLEVFGFEPGSFIINMQPKAYADMTGYAYISKALEIIDLVNFDIDNPEKTIDNLLNYKGHFVTTYINLLKFIIENNTSFSYEWAMPSSKTSIFRNIIPRKADPLYKALIEKKEIGKEELELTGSFTMIDTKLKKWRIYTIYENKEYKGISDITLDGITTEPSIYHLKCEEILEEEVVSKKEIKILHLVSCKEYRNNMIEPQKVVLALNDYIVRYHSSTNPVIEARINTIVHIEITKYLIENDLIKVGPSVSGDKLKDYFGVNIWPRDEISKGEVQYKFSDGSVKNEQLKI